MMRWLFSDVMWPLVLMLVQVLALVPCATDSAIGVMWCQCQLHCITKKSHVASQFNCLLDLRNAMVPLMTPLTSCDASASGMQWCYWWYHWHHVTLMLAPMVLHDQKSHVAHHFDHLDLRNAVVPLMTPSA